MIETFYPADEESWEYENEAEQTGDFFDGVLLDNYMLKCRDGYCAVFEEYVNEWTSRHVYKLARYDDQADIDELWDEFYARQEEA